jgi:hypothetical protein
MLRRRVYLEGHRVGQKHHMANINTHAVTAHGVHDLVDDARSGRFDSERAKDFDDMVGSGAFPVHTERGHDFLKAASFDKEREMTAIGLADDGAGNRRHTLLRTVSGDAHTIGGVRASQGPRAPADQNKSRLTLTTTVGSTRFTCCIAR